MKGSPSSKSAFTTFSVLELCPNLLKLEPGVFLSYGHILQFLYARLATGPYYVIGYGVRLVSTQVSA